MSRTLILLLLCLPLFAGCTTTRPAGTSGAGAEVVQFSEVDRWLQLYGDVSRMSTEEAVERLVTVDRPEGTGQLFYYGLLNSQLESYGAWTQARDTFQDLLELDTLSPQQQQLVDILRQYNQNRINLYLKQKDLLAEQAKMQEQLENAEQDNERLQQQIQALTDLETVISTRREE